MKTTCEIVVQDILPNLRAAIARELMNSYNLNQGEAARLLNVSQPAVSQYIRQLRGKNSLLESKKVIDEIKDISSKLYSKQISSEEYSAKMCSISKIVLEETLKIKTDMCPACK